MSKLKPLKQRKVINILLKNGFKEVRRGKHITFKKYLPNGEVLTTWVPYHSEISVFVLQYIIKQTRKPKEEFL
jgi:predicted RNA binding protein YcfA (HicA-like mRNA interferase family)